MTQAPTPGPLSGDGCYDEHQPGCDCVIPEQTTAPMPSYLERLAPTAPVEASGSEREAMEAALAELKRIPAPLTDDGDVTSWDSRNEVAAGIHAAETWLERALNLRPQPSGETREAVARIIDPSAWRRKDEGHPGGENFVKKSLRLADRILALIRPAPVASGGQHSSATDFPPGEVTDEWAERFCEAVNWSPDGQECKAVEGQVRCVSFRELAKGYILSAIATQPAITPVTAPVAETAGEAVAWAWTRVGADIDGDPLTIKGKFGDYDACVTLSRTTRTWSATVNNGHGRLDYATENEARAYAEQTVRDLLSARLVQAEATLRLYATPPVSAITVAALERISGQPLYYERDTADGPRRRCPSCAHAWPVATPEHHAPGCTRIIASEALASLKFTAAQEGGSK